MSVPVARVADLAEQVRGVSYGKEDASSTPRPGYLPVLRAGNITDEGLRFDDLVFVPAERISAKQRIRRHDVVIAASSGSLDVVGKAAPALADYEGGFGAFCKVLRPGPKVNPDYFAHYFKTQDYRRRVSALAAGVNINNLRNEHLDEMKIPLPPLPEQRRIAEVLDRGEALWAKRRAALAQFDILTQSIFLDMFGNPGSNPKRWPLAKLGDAIFSASDGPHVSPSYADSGVPFLSTRHVRAGEITWEDLKFISHEDAEFHWRKCKPERGDILYTKGGTTGLAAMVRTDQPFAVWVHVALLKPNPDVVDSNWLEAILNGEFCYRQSQALTHGIANRDLGLTRMVKIRMFLPPLSLQCEFARRIAMVQKLKTTHRASLAEFDALFAALQQRAFRGEL